MKAALDYYNQISKLQGLGFMPELKSGSIILDPSTSKQFDEQHALHHYLTKFFPASGWLCYQSQTNRFIEQQILEPPTKESGWLLQGELYNPKHDLSIHIRQTASASWLVTQLNEADQNPQETGLLETVSMIAMPIDKDDSPPPQQPTEDRLFYRVYWQQTENQGYQRCASRFIGFTDDQTKEVEK